MRIVRIFNTYGPRMQPNDGRVVSNFVRPGAAAASRSRSTATAPRPAASATSSDEVRGFLALLDGDEIGPVNIGNPDEFTMLELAELVLELTGFGRRASFTSHCRTPTIRSSVSPTSPWRATGWGGSRRSSFARVSSLTIPYFAAELQQSGLV